MKKTIKIVLTAALVAVMAGSASAQVWVSGYSGIAHKGPLHQWVHEIMLGAKHKNMKTKFQSMLAGMAFDHKAMNTDAIDLSNKLANFAENNKKEQRAAFAKQVKNDNEALALYDEMQNAVNKGEVFKNYALTFQVPVDVKMPRRANQQLRALFVKPAKELSEKEVLVAKKYNDGVVYLELFDAQTATKLFLIVKPDTLTVDVIYNDPSFDRSALKSHGRDLLAIQAGAL